MTTTSNYDQAIGMGWTIPDTAFARQALDVFACVDTGLHNIYGEWCGRTPNFFRMGNEESVALDRRLSSNVRQPIEIDKHGASMFCTNTIGERLARRLVDCPMYFEISAAEGMCGNASEPEIARHYRDEEFQSVLDFAVTDEFDRLVAIVIEDRAYAPKMYLHVRLWPTAAMKEAMS